MYKDDTTDAKGSLADKTYEDETLVMASGLDCEVTTPEVKKNYVNASVMLPRGNTISRGKVIGQKRDADGNDVGRMNDKPILNTHKYIVDFDYEEVIKLTANVIAKSMHASCDGYENEYVMIESIIYYHNNDKDITVPDHKVVHIGQSFMQRSIVGWKICVQRRDGLTSCQELNDLT